MEAVLTKRQRQTLALDAQVGRALRRLVRSSWGNPRGAVIRVEGLGFKGH